MKKVIDFLEKLVVGIALSFLLVSGFSFTQGNLFSQKAFAVKPVEPIEWKKLIDVNSDNPCPLTDGLCVEIIVEG